MKTETVLWILAFGVLLLAGRETKTGCSCGGH